MIRYMVDGQRLLAIDKWVPVAGTAGAYTLHFTFSDDWEGLTRHAVFKSGDTEVASIINSDSECSVPWEVLTEPGWLSVGVYGAKSGVRYPTVWERQRPILPAPDDATEGTEPTDTLWQQFVDAVAEDANKAAESKRAAAASAAAAAKSAEDSEGSASAAAASATEAAASASAAAKDASHAAESEQRSVEHAQNAEESARAAEGHAEDASESAQTAAGYARDAEICAMDAASSAEEAKANAEKAKAVWRPSVSDEGVISWTKSDETEAPESQNIRGQKGEPGKDGKDADPALGISGASVGQTVEISAVDASGKPTAWKAVDAPEGGGSAAEAPVQSVNGKTGAVVLTASDVGADAAGTASKAVSEHNSSASAHQDIRNAIPTIPSAIKNPNALTFTGAVTGSYDGSAAKTVNIPTVPASLKNPKALTFTGAASGSYDGSEAVTINIPSGGSGGSGEGTDISLGISGAAVGKVPAVATIDSDGKPTSWQAAELPEGAKGDKGDTGAQGVGITSVKQTTTSTADSGSNVVTVTLSDGSTSTFTVKNGSKGSTGATGATGAAGADGRSAYSYAQEQGYGGSEAQFGEALVRVTTEEYALASEIPTIPETLPNPNKLTFTGNVSKTYDGSAAVSVPIPTTLKNPNALTFTGTVTGTYDGSSAKSVAIPEGVPAVTGADNGKVLTVVGGVWTAADAPSGGSGSSGDGEAVDLSGWTLLAAVTLEEAAEVIDLTMEDTDGYDEFYILDYTPIASTAGTIYVRAGADSANTAIVASISGGLSKNNTYNASRACHVERVNGNTVCTFPLGVTSSSAGNLIKQYHKNSVPMAYLRYDASGAALPAGTFVVVYGLKRTSGSGGSTPDQFIGATATEAGESGLVPAPAAGNNTQFLRGDGSWATAVPSSTSSDAGKFLRVGEDGSAVWETVGNAEEASF